MNIQDADFREYLKYTLIAIGFFLFVWLYVMEFKYFDRTFSVKKLILGTMLFGALLGLVWAMNWKKQLSDQVDRLRLFLSLIIGLGLVMPYFGSLANRLIARTPVRYETVEFIGETPYFASRFGVIEGETLKPTGYYVFFFRHGQLERVKSTVSMFPENERGDAVTIPVRKGILGFSYILIEETYDAFGI